jgi:tRNA-(ms[2]io[6]A)-hydroxylase
MSDFLQPVLDFLACPTPQAWIDAAISDIPLLLQDHANCEKKGRQYRRYVNV